MSSWIDLKQDPFKVFGQWFEAAIKETDFEPTKLTLATLGADGLPSARVVLLKAYDSEGFVFFTNFDSVKGEELKNNPKAAMVFHWQKPFHRQVRIRGLVEKLSFAESNAYFQTRERGSQIGAWASPQSHKISGRQELMERVQLFEDKFANQEIPCPENWGGYRVKPMSLEFWQSGEHRLHDRIRFIRKDLLSPWTAEYLAP
ncbi:MAG: pyridoxamine 5'-phosphate oxidase [Bdellovibrionales bacterium]|nr:pyridoxamine 5'-phosphate oxidase [Bdellovibrionales bacterium]